MKAIIEFVQTLGTAEILIGIALIAICIYAWFDCRELDKIGIMKEKIDCGCEGSCPICRFGEVDNHKCDKCGTEFCPVCHGTLKKLLKYLPQNVIECKCETKLKS